MSQFDDSSSNPEPASAPETPTQIPAPTDEKNLKRKSSSEKPKNPVPKKIRKDDIATSEEEEIADDDDRSVDSQSTGSLEEFIADDDSDEEEEDKSETLPRDPVDESRDLLESLTPAEREAVASGSGDPLALKHELARRVVERFHDADAATRAADHFRRVVQERGTPSEVAQYDFSLGGAAEVSLLDLVDQLGLAASRGEVRRLVSQGAVSVDDERVTDPLRVLGAGSYLLKLGRRRFAQVHIA